MKTLFLKIFDFFFLFPVFTVFLSGCVEERNTGNLSNVTNPLNPVVVAIDEGDTTITHKTGTSLYTWTFTCGGGKCLSGTFLGGDYWIAPKKIGEQVILVSVTTSGADGGLEINPKLPGTKQGFLSCVASSSDPTIAGSYDPNLNRSLTLPLNLSINSSLVKATRKSTSCPNIRGQNNCCIDNYDVVTLLPSPPLANGATAFRPAFAGNSKKIYYLNDFDFTKIPSSELVSTVVKDGYYKEYTDDFASIHNRWHTPYIDHYIYGLGDGGRLFAPLGTPGFSGNLSTGYGADIASAYLGGVLRIMGTDPLTNKMPAITGLLQRGIDLYGSYKAGFKWPSGAAQSLGRKPPIVFFASLVNNPSIFNEVKIIAANNSNVFHEDGQIQVTTAGSNIPLWGDQYCSQENSYWGMLYAEQLYKGNPSNSLLSAPAQASEKYWPYKYPNNIQIGGGDNFRTCADPYGFIDGPAGLAGTEYMENATGPIIGYHVAQSLMPSLCVVAGDPDLNAFVKRILTTGIKTQPDPCAPPDPLESPSCNPVTGSGCTKYGVTWGSAGGGKCILNGPGQMGRFPERDRSPMTNIYAEPQLGKSLRLTSPIMINGC